METDKHIQHSKSMGSPWSVEYGVIWQVVSITVHEHTDACFFLLGKSEGQNNWPDGQLAQTRKPMPSRSACKLEDLGDDRHQSLRKGIVGWPD